jgi:hypothetical protein
VGAYNFSSYSYFNTWGHVFLHAWGSCNCLTSSCVCNVISHPQNHAFHSTPNVIRFPLLILLWKRTFWKESYSLEKQLCLSGSFLSVIGRHYFIGWDIIKSVNSWYFSIFHVGSMWDLVLFVWEEIIYWLILFHFH